MERSSRPVAPLALAAIFATLLTVATVAESGQGSLRAVHRVGSGDQRHSGVVWVVQLSDLHISKFHTERAFALQKLMGTILAAIQPSLVLISGDLTDAKNKGGTTTQQYEEEWRTYYDTMTLISEESGIPLNLFYDLRGNHDKYGVPSANSTLDYYRRYSCNARQKRTGLVQSVTLLDNGGGWKTLFVGIDDSMSVGLRGPSNLFGHPSDSVIAELDRELSQWDKDNSTPVTKIVFGHFPTSFTAASESGRRSDEILTKHNVSAFVCGHLHCKFGRQLYKHHLTEGLGEFWEWEMGDWRVNRIVRILAIDHGRVSFVDLDFRQMSIDVLNHGKQFVMPTVILPTSPLDSRTMLRSSDEAKANKESDPGTVRALVFSKTRPTSVTANVFDSVTHSFVDYVLLESLKMDLVSDTSKANGVGGGPFLYQAFLNSQNYTDSTGTRYWLQILVVEDEGHTTSSSMWPFSVEGKRGPFALHGVSYIAMGIEWDSFYPYVLWTIIFVIVGGFLLLPRLVFLYLEKKGVYDNWAYGIFNLPPDSSFPYFKLPVWALLEGARNRYLWWMQVLYCFVLLVFPWFWGRVLADDYPIGYMTMWGWTVWPSKGTVAHQSGLGWPDIMGIVLPYFCAIVLPMVLLLSAMCAEQAACELIEAAATSSKSEGGRALEEEGAAGRTKKTNGGGLTSSSGIGLGTLVSGETEAGEARPLLESQEGTASYSADGEGLETPSEDEEELEAVVTRERPMWPAMKRKVRIAYFIGCFVLVFFHLRLCVFMALAYGAQSVFLSPIYVWAVPVLVASSIYMTSSVRPRTPVVN